MSKHQPNLGLASTEEMMREVICRLKLSATCKASVDSLHETEWALTLAEMLGSMDTPTREYRTATP